MTKNKRIFYFDLLRVFAIFSIVATHTTNKFVKGNPEFLFQNFWYYAVTLRWMGGLGIGIFLMLTGALLFKRKESIKSFIKKRFSRVLIPDIFWMAIFLIAMYYFASIDLLSFNEAFSIKLLFDTFMGFAPHGRYFWYIPVILVVYLFIAVINRLMDLYDVDILKYLLYISIPIIIIQQFHPIIANLSVYGAYGYLIFSIYGYYLFKYDLLENKYLKKFNVTSEKITIASLIVAILSFSQVVSLAVIHYTNPSLGPLDSHFNIFNIIAVMAIFLFFKYFEQCSGLLGKIFNFIRKHFSKIIYSISVCSYGMYLSHIIIKFIVRATVKQSYFGGHFITCLTVWLILTFVISWLTVLVLSKIPYLKKFSGV